MRDTALLWLVVVIGVVMLAAGSASAAATTSGGPQRDFSSVGYSYGESVAVAPAAENVSASDDVRGSGRARSNPRVSKSAPVVLRLAAEQIGPSGLPRGFGNAADFGAFGDDLHSGLRGAGYDDVTAIFQGSSVTGQGFRTGAAFDVGRVSDFVIALASPQLLDRASALGIGLRSGGTRTGPLTASQLQRLGLGDPATDLGTSTGGPVNFMIFDSAAGATARSSSIVVPG